jgi:hypothetical protein
MDIAHFRTSGEMKFEQSFAHKWLPLPVVEKKRKSDIFCLLINPMAILQIVDAFLNDFFCVEQIDPPTDAIIINDTNITSAQAKNNLD